MSEKDKKIVLLNKRLIEYKKYKNKPKGKKIRFIGAILLFVFCMLSFSTITTEFFAYLLGALVTIAGISADVYVTEQIKKHKKKLEEEINELNVEIYQESLSLEKSNIANNNIYYKVGDNEYTHEEVCELSNICISEGTIQQRHSQQILKK